MKITLRKIKGISELTFVIPDPGVWIVTGLNGAGKSSLFAAIYRMGAANAFQKYFRTGSYESTVDRYANAEIEYEVDEERVIYRYGGSRWKATPARNIQLISNTQYSAIAFIEANAERIEPFPNEIEARRIRDCTQELREFLHSVLGNSKWLDLKYVNTSRGNSQRAYLIPHPRIGNARTSYYSEKSFSLGELCVLKLAVRIFDIEPDGLVLVDEVEMALHPQAQVRLLQKITEVAQAKNLTVLFSTHSATLIKSIPRTNLIYLQNGNDGRVSTIYKPFPALVLGDIAFEDEFKCDIIFFVEDTQAQTYLRSLIDIYLANCRRDPTTWPLYRIVPVGGWPQVIDMVNSSPQLLPAHVRRHALLDADAEATLRAAIQRGQQPLTAQFRNVERFVSYLPCTPEQGLVDFIETRVVGNAALTRTLNQSFPGHMINLAPVVSSYDYRLLTAANLRTRAKDRLNHLTLHIARTTGFDEGHIHRCLYGKFCEHAYTAPFAQLQQLLAPIFNAR